MIFDKRNRNIRLTRKIFRAMDLPRSGKIIDVSCGGGRLLKKIENQHPQLELTGADINPGYLAKHPRLSQINFITAQASALPFPNSTFNIVMCSLSVHHYENLSAIINEMKRILNDTGRMYITDITPSNTWSQYLYNLIGCDEPYHFEKYYTENELNSLLSKSGLKIITLTKISSLPRTVVYEITKTGR